MRVCELTEVSPILGTAPSLGDPPFAPKVLIGSERADEVSPQGAEFGPELKDGLGLLTNHTTLLQSSSPFLYSAIKPATLLSAQLIRMRDEPGHDVSPLVAGCCRTFT